MICLPPASTKALFDPSSVSFRYVRSELNQPDPVVPGRPLYDFGLSIGYLHKGISFITGGEITMSGAPEDIRVTHGPLDVYSELYLYGEYPTIEFA